MTASPSNQKITQRQASLAGTQKLMREGLTPFVAKLLASRGLTDAASLTGATGLLLKPEQLAGTQEAASALAQAIKDQTHIVVVADYDCDGATACTIALRGLRGFGAKVDYVVPDRMVHGYGLTPSVVDLARERFPDVQMLVTVDNGIASYAGVDAARDAGLSIIVTDHHLPSAGKGLPNADVIVDPSAPGCTFSSKALAGCGVIWYVLWALQNHLRAIGVTVAPEAQVSRLLPLVAVGTVADVVPLDGNNRVLVQAGLARIRRGESFPGIEALATTGFGNNTRISELRTTDIAFGIGPRINAAGRLETMDVGIACLMEDDLAGARELARTLGDINSKRKTLEQETVEEAFLQACGQIQGGTYTIAVADERWHPGVIGIVAGRIKEQRRRPTFVLAKDPDTGLFRGSGRSILGFNLKDALDQVDKACPGLMPRFGGHAMAAGLTLRPGGFEEFKEAFEDQVQHQMDPTLLSQEILHDGELDTSKISLATAQDLAAIPWGQLFPEPDFIGNFEVLTVKLTGPYKNQLKMKLAAGGREFDAVCFRFAGPVPGEGQMVRLAYKLSARRGADKHPRLQLLVDAVL